MVKSLKRGILVVDNEDRVCRAVKFRLESEGYFVETANTAQEARRKLHENQIHVAIIDIRLTPLEGPEDKEGFVLADEIKNQIPIIIYTAYENKDVLRDAVFQHGASGSVDKTESDAAEKLVKTVNTVFSEKVKVNFELDIEDVYSINKITKSISLPSSVSTPLEFEIEQILAELFNDASTIVVENFFKKENLSYSSKSISSIVKVTAHRNDETGQSWTQSVIVKFSAIGNIIGEVRGYELAKRYFGGQRLPRIDKVATAKNLGGMIITLIDADNWDQIVRLSDVFFDRDVSKNIKMFNQLFDQTFGKLLRGSQEEVVKLADIYSKALNLNPDNLTNAAVKIDPGIRNSPNIRIDGLQETVQNPVLWAIPNKEFRQFSELGPVCIVHGDMHTGNLLIDNNNRCWLIDFARVGKSHAFRDFAELETDLKFNLFELVSAQEMKEFEKSLLVATYAGELTGKPKFKEDRTDHLYKIIINLRKSALKLVHIDQGSLYQYYVALFFHTLNILRLKHIKSANKKKHALISAALLSERLDNWPNS